MRTNKKAGIQISLGFLITLIIAIVVFILSIAFLGDFFTQATELRESLDQHSRAQIEALLAGNARVAIPIETQTVSRGDPAYYGVGIRNTLPENYFKVQLHQSGGFIPAGPDNNLYNINCVDGECRIIDATFNDPTGRFDVNLPVINYQVGRQGNLKIDINQQDTVVVATNPLSNSPRGHYIFNLMICSASGDHPSECNPNNLYDNSIHKLHMIVR